MAHFEQLSMFGDVPSEKIYARDELQQISTDELLHMLIEQGKVMRLKEQISTSCLRNAIINILNK